MFDRLSYRLRKARARRQSARGIAPNPLDCARCPVYGDRLPLVMGSGGWPIEEPSRQEVAHFLDCLDNAIRNNRYHLPNYFGGKDGGSMDCTLYTDVIRVKQWLRLLADHDGLLFDDTTRRK